MQEFLCIILSAVITGFVVIGYHLLNIKDQLTNKLWDIMDVMSRILKVTKSIHGDVLLVNNKVDSLDGFLLELSKRNFLNSVGQIYTEGYKESGVGIIELMEGVSSVEVSPLRYVELLAKEAELTELKLKLKEVTEDEKS